MESSNEEIYVYLDYRYEEGADVEEGADDRYEEGADVENLYMYI